MSKAYSKKNLNNSKTTSHFKPLTKQGQTHNGYSRRQKWKEVPKAQQC